MVGRVGVTGIPTEGDIQVDDTESARETWFQVKKEKEVLCMEIELRACGKASKAVETQIDAGAALHGPETLLF